uniref:Uncharacterized protein n=1 Tax=Arundo donax TaxID=35708 RepID=A0A0A9F0B0_ARUDO
MEPKTNYRAFGHKLVLYANALPMEPKTSRIIQTEAGKKRTGQEHSNMLGTA